MFKNVNYANEMNRMPVMTEDDYHELKDMVRTYVMCALDNKEEVDMDIFVKENSIRELTAKEERMVLDLISKVEKEWQEIEERERVGA